MSENFDSNQEKQNIVEVLGMPLSKEVYEKYRDAFVYFLENNYTFPYLEFANEEERRQAVQVALQMSHALLESSQMLEHAPIKEN
ncbi:MAG: hypothetical protein RLZZ480_402 [Candidatus Parcubacteria bacterium]|jgi:hypothetical protein